MGRKKLRLFGYNNLEQLDAVGKLSIKPSDEEIAMMQEEIKNISSNKFDLTENLRQFHGVQDFLFDNRLTSKQEQYLLWCLHKDACLMAIEQIYEFYLVENSSKVYEKLNNVMKQPRDTFFYLEKKDLCDGLENNISNKFINDFCRKMKISEKTNRMLKLLIKQMIVPIEILPFALFSIYIQYINLCISQENKIYDLGKDIPVESEKVFKDDFSDEFSIFLEKNIRCIAPKETRHFKLLKNTNIKEESVEEIEEKVFQKIKNNTEQRVEDKQSDIIDIHLRFVEYLYENADHINFYLNIYLYNQYFPLVETLFFITLLPNGPLTEIYFEKEFEEKEQLIEIKPMFTRHYIMMLANKETRAYKKELFNKAEYFVKYFNYFVNDWKEQMLQDIIGQSETEENSIKKARREKYNEMLQIVAEPEYKEWNVNLIDGKILDIGEVNAERRNYYKPAIRNLICNYEAFCCKKQLFHLDPGQRLKVFEAMYNRIRKLKG